MMFFVTKKPPPAILPLSRCIIVKNYIKYLYKFVEQQNQERELAKQLDAKKHQTLQSAPKPLEQQVLKLTRSRGSDRSWTMAEFVVSLEGTHSQHPHPQKIAEILLRHNWKRHRTYGKNAGRYWMPPSKD